MAQAKWRAGLDLLVTALMLVLIVTMGWRLLDEKPSAAPPSAPKIQIPAQPVSLDGAYLRGSLSARVAVVIYIDYECPACRAFEKDTLPTVVREYVNTGQVLLAFRPFPLGRRGAEGVHEAALAHCAGSHGEFWKAHEALFANVGETIDTKSIAVAKATGLESTSLAQCVTGARPRVARDVDDALRLGVVATPTFLIGGIDATNSIAVRVAHQGVAQGSLWFRKLLQAVIDAETR